MAGRAEANRCCTRGAAARVVRVDLSPAVCAGRMHVNTSVAVLMCVRLLLYSCLRHDQRQQPHVAFMSTATDVFTCIHEVVAVLIFET